MRRSSLVCAAVLAALGAASAEAHEFWLDPLPARPEAGAPLRTDLRVGQGFAGDVYPYLSKSFESFRLTVRGTVYDISGNQGDLPAVGIKAAPAGLNVISYFSRPTLVAFDDAEKFTTYLDYEGLDWVRAAHAARGLPPVGFKEAFSRAVKTLVQSGPVMPEDRDVVVGMPFELVAEANPYADPAAQELSVVLLWQQKPYAGAQIAIFRDAGPVAESLTGPVAESAEGSAPGAIQRTTIRTDAAGRATISLVGGGRFLLSAVHMREAAPELDAVWESHWASMSFALPPAAGG